MVQYDYIVVGGGSSGCVLSNRLSARSTNHVLLIEAGRDLIPGEEPADIRDTFYTAAYVKANLWPDTMVQWLRPEPEQISPPAVFYEQARVIGGGSSVNAMVALRGTELDFAEWSSLGAEGWTWRDVLPFYRKLECDLDFDDEGHGRTGPIPVRRHSRSVWPPFVRAVTRELEARGYRYIDDVNAGERDGFGRIPMSNLPTQRVSAAMGYLPAEVRARKNLQILTATEVTGLVMDRTRCLGVTTGRGEARKTHLAREVILCAGSLRTPALLLRSGLGPPEELKSLGIAVHAPLRGVGRNLHDHPTFAAAAYLRLGATQSASLRPHANAGLFYSSGLESCPVLDMYMPITNKVSWHAVGERIGGLFMVLMKPFSRGCVRLSSADPDARAVIEVNAFDDERDLARAKQAMRFASELLRVPSVRSLTHYRFGGSFSERISALNTYHRANQVKSTVATLALDGPSRLRNWLMETMICPGGELDDLVADDARLETWLRDNITGFFHPVGTCRIGGEHDETAVVTSHGRVRGVDGLRIADASLMPVIVRATTNLTAMMIGEKIAQAIADGY